MSWLLKLFNIIFSRDFWIDPAQTNPPPPPPPVTNRAKLLLAVAEARLGKEASPKDKVPDEVACVESLGNIIREVMPFPTIYGTHEALQYFKKSNQWKASLDMKPGYVIINATGTGNGSMRGHCGIILGGGKIASNNSLNGLWRTDYTLDSWKARYRIKGGMTTYVFEPL